MAGLTLDSASTLPRDGTAGALAGRAWRPDRRAGRAGPPWWRCGPTGCTTSRRPSRRCATCASGPTPPRPCARRRRASGSCSLDEALANTPPDARDPGRPWLLAPVDLQAIKAAGVTFAVSMLERVIEERARGDAGAAAGIRAEIVGAGGRGLLEAPPGLRRGHAAQGGADRARGLVAISRGRHRAGRRDLHQGPAHGGGGHRRRRRAPPGLGLEQPRARGRAGRGVGRADRRRHARQRRQPARRRGPLGAAARQGQGQQRVLRDRPLPALLRRHLHARPPAAPWRSR